MITSYTYLSFWFVGGIKKLLLQPFIKRVGFRKIHLGCILFKGRYGKHIVLHSTTSYCRIVLPRGRKHLDRDQNISNVNIFFISYTYLEIFLIKYFYFLGRYTCYLVRLLLSSVKPLCLKLKKSFAKENHVKLDYVILLYPFISNILSANVFWMFFINSRLNRCNECNYYKSLMIYLIKNVLLLTFLSLHVLGQQKKNETGEYFG